MTIRQASLRGVGTKKVKVKSVVGVVEENLLTAVAKLRDVIGNAKQ